MDEQLHRHGFIVRGGQAIEAMLVLAPPQCISKDEREKLKEDQMPDWNDVKRRQKDTDVTHAKKHGKSFFLQAQRER